GARGALEQIDRAPEQLRAPDQPPAARTAPQALLETDVALLELPVGERLLDALEELRLVERLGHVVERTALDRAHRGVDLRIPGDEDHLDVGIARLDLVEQRHARHAWHPDVGDDDVEAATLELLHRVLTRERHRRRVAGTLEEVGARLSEVTLVVDHEDALAAALHAVSHRRSAPEPRPGARRTGRGIRRPSSASATAAGSRAPRRSGACGPRAPRRGTR